MQLGYIDYWRIVNMPVDKKRTNAQPDRTGRSENYMKHVEVRRNNQSQYSPREFGVKLEKLNASLQAKKKAARKKATALAKQQEQLSPKSKPIRVVRLRYTRGVPAIKQLTQVSTSGRSRIVDRSTLWGVNRGRGTYIVSTSSGLMTDKQARRKGIGGKIRFYIF